MNIQLTTVLRGLGLALLLACQPALAQSDTVVIKRATELRDAPGDSARSLAALAVQTPVTRLGPRQGPWIEVRTAQGNNGWVHMFDVASSTPPPTGNTATGALRGLTSLFGRGAAAPAPASATATIGIRGLGAEDITNAQPNLDAVARAEGLRQSAAQAQQFGAGASLAALAVEPLPVPAAPTRSTTGSTGNPGSTNEGVQR